MAVAAPPAPVPAPRRSSLYDPSAYLATATDFFCGLGGSTEGLHGIPGLKVVMAANHWSLAVETHNTNHQETDHDCADISQVDPRRYPRTDIAWFSPECTNHSKAKGKKRSTSAPDRFGDTLPAEAEERSRATMWDAVRFAEYHRYDYIIVENVPDVVEWVMFPAWQLAFTCMGYEHKIISLNSMFAHAAGDPAPQSRNRVYIVLWLRKNRRPDFDRWLRPSAWCEHCDEWVQAVQVFKPGKTVGDYGPRNQYVYRCPRIHKVEGKGDEQPILTPPTLPGGVAVDWSIRGIPIGERAAHGRPPLREKTLGRIEYGVDTYVTPYFVPSEGRAGLTQTKPITQPLRTQTTRRETGIAVPPFIAELRGTSKTRLLSDPLGTFTAGGRHHGLTVPDPDSWDYWAAIYNYATGKVRSPGDPLNTLTTVQGDAVLVGSVGEVDIDRILYRMLEPAEAKVGMGLPHGYVVLGNRREQQKMAGNAVTPPAARDLGYMVMEALLGEHLV